MAVEYIQILHSQPLMVVLVVEVTVIEWLVVGKVVYLLALLIQAVAVEVMETGNHPMVVVEQEEQAVRVW